jgi:ABC-type lipoprotein release transport system permease subunit
MTGTTVRMAWRNLWRNSRRTGLALAAIGLSVTLVLAYTSLMRGYGQWLVETLTGPMLGHVQAHAPQWRKDRLMDRTLRGVGATLDALRGDPAVTQATARVYAPALAARGRLRGDGHRPRHGRRDWIDPAAQ